MSESLGRKFGRWDLEGHRTTKGGQFSLLHQKLLFLARARFDKYLITAAGAAPDFIARLETWINQLSDERDQRALVELASVLCFIGEDETNALIRSAFLGPITRWVIEQCKLSVRDQQFDQKLKVARDAETRYVGATDSFPIHDFYKITTAVSHSDKLNLKAFWKSGQLDKLASNWRADTNIRRVVILEDFVGSGEQTSKMIREWVLAIRKPTLFCPLIICPDGVTEYRRIVATLGLLSFVPVLEVRDQELLNANSAPQARSLEALLFELVQRVHSKVEGDKTAHPPPYSPFGFPAPDGTGCPVILRGNVPDNALPIVHFKSSSWEPLFPRKPRELI